MSRVAASDRRRSRHGAPLRRVVVATDLSRGAELAMARAARLPLAPDARIVLLKVERERSRPEGEPGPAARLASEAERLLRAVRGRAPRARVDPLVLRGDTHQQIAACAATSSADLVVLGRHGHRPLADLFGIGTTADRLVRVSDTPVLVVGRRARAEYQYPVVALDHPPAVATRRAIRMARRLAGSAVPWVALHVADDSFAAALRRGRVSSREIAEVHARDGAALEREIGRGLARFPGRRWRIHLEWGEPSYIVASAAAKLRADLIVIGTRTRSTLDRRILGSVAEAVLRRARCDVLVVPPASS